MLFNIYVFKFRWSAIAARLPGRTDNEIKNYWNTHVRKRLLRTGIDPVTHAPRLDLLDISSILRSAIGNVRYSGTNGHRKKTKPTQQKCHMVKKKKQHSKPSGRKLNPKLEIIN